MRHDAVSQLIVEGTDEAKRARGIEFTYIEQRVKGVGMISFREVKDVVQDQPR